MRFRQLIAIVGPRSHDNYAADARYQSLRDHRAHFTHCPTEPISTYVFQGARENANKRREASSEAPGNTLSAAQNFINAPDEHGNPIFVGEPSGSRPNHVGDDTTVILPYSRIIGSVACALHQTEFRDERKWIAPAIPIELSSGQYSAQRDPSLERVLSLIASRQR